MICAGIFINQSNFNTRLGYMVCRHMKFHVSIHYIQTNVITNLYQRNIQFRDVLRFSRTSCLKAVKYYVTHILINNK